MRVCSGFTVRDRRESFEELGFAQRRKAGESGVRGGEGGGADHGWLHPLRGPSRAPAASPSERASPPWTAPFGGAWGLGMPLRGDGSGAAAPNERRAVRGGEARGTAGEEGRAGNGAGASGGGPAGPGGAVQLRGSGGDGLPDLRRAMPAMLHGRNVSKAAGEGGERRSAVPPAAGVPSGVATDGALRSLRSALAHGGSGSGVG